LFQIRRLPTKAAESAGRPDLTSIRSAYLFELGSREKVAASGVADFGHPAWIQPLTRRLGSAPATVVVAS